MFMLKCLFVVLFAGMLAACSPSGGTSGASSSGQNPTAALTAFTVADLQAAQADALAQTPPDTVAANCYAALIPVVQGALAQAGAVGTGIKGGFSAFQKARDGVKLAQGGIPSSLNVACAPLVLDAANTVIGIAAKVGIPSSLTLPIALP